MASTQPFGKIAFVGATGHIGRFLAEAVLKTGKHEVTVLTRSGSKGTLPDGVKSVKIINYDDQASIVAALRGQQFLVIAVGVTVPPDTQSKLYKAAAEAGVQYVMPSFYGVDIRDPKIAQERHGAIILQGLAEMEALGLSYVSLACGVWYEWSLALGEAFFGFQIPERKVTFYDDGKTPLTVSTWLQCGRALAALLSLPVDGASPCLSDWKNKAVHISSFRLSQRDMLNSLHRVLSTSDDDWEITFESAAKRHKEGLEEFAKGNIKGLAKHLYANHFIRSKAGELGNSAVTSNEVLGLPSESLDEATGRVVDMVESGWNPSA